MVCWGIRRKQRTNDLTRSSHIADVAGKANRSLGFLRRNFKQCTKDVKAATYTTMVRPVLDYASTVWYPHKQGDINVSNGAKIRNRYNQVPYLTQDTNGKVTNSQKTPQTRAKRSALSDSRAGPTPSRQICVQWLYFPHTWMHQCHGGGHWLGEPSRKAIHCKSEPPLQDPAWISGYRELPLHEAKW